MSPLLYVSLFSDFCLRGCYLHPGSLQPPRVEIKRLPHESSGKRQKFVHKGPNTQKRKVLVGPLEKLGQDCKGLLRGVKAKSGHVKTEVSWHHWSVITCPSCTTCLISMIYHLPMSLLVFKFQKDHFRDTLGPYCACAVIRSISRCRQASQGSLMPIWIPEAGILGKLIRRQQLTFLTDSTAGSWPPISKWL